MKNIVKFSFFALLIGSFSMAYASHEMTSPESNDGVIIEGTWVPTGKK